MARLALLLVIVVVVVIIFLVYTGVSAVVRRTRSGAQPALTSPATVVNKRLEITNGWSSYYATFELPSGERIELATPGESAGTLVVGDMGTLIWAGSTFHSFQRQILR